MRCGHASVFDGKSHGKNVAAAQPEKLTVIRFQHLTVKGSAERTFESTLHAVCSHVFDVTVKAKARRGCRFLRLMALRRAACIREVSGCFCDRRPK